VIIIGGMLGGVFTPTEAAAVATAYGLFVGFVIYQELKVSALPRICYKVLISTPRDVYRGPGQSLYLCPDPGKASELAANFLFNISSSATIIMLVILIFIIILGMFLSTTPALILSIPFSFPL